MANKHPKKPTSSHPWKKRLVVVDVKELRPMLAARECELDDIRYPVRASVKLDGYRALRQGKQLVTRGLLPVPNLATRAFFSHLPEGCDGELICGDPAHPNCIQLTSSAVSTHAGNPDVHYYLFDFCPPGMENTAFESRYEILKKCVKETRRIHILEQHLLASKKEVLKFEEFALSAGYEGVILRDPYGFYKHGRSTFKEQYLVKLKRFVDSEARVVSFRELVHNENEKTTSRLGYSKRSGKKAGKVPGGTLGSMSLVDIHDGRELKMGSGLTASQRDILWEERGSLIGRIVKYKHFPIGEKDRPRQPIFIGFRDEEDL